MMPTTLNEARTPVPCPGRILEVLSGHEAPVSRVHFSPVENVLVSSSWDKTLKACPEGSDTRLRAHGKGLRGATRGPEWHDSGSSLVRSPAPHLQSSSTYPNGPPHHVPRKEGSSFTVRFRWPDPIAAAL